MNVLSFRFATFLVTTLVPAILLAGTPNRYYWSDSKGLVPMLPVQTECVLNLEDQSSFNISQKQNSKLDSFSKLQGSGFFGWSSDNVVDRSLLIVKSISEKSSTAKVRVVSIPKNISLKGIVDLATPGAEGSIDKTSLQEVGNFVIGVLAPPEIQTPTPAPFNLKDSFWQATSENDKYLILNCGEPSRAVKYTFFDVYDSVSIDPIAQIAVRAEEAKIFENVKVYTPEEANQLFSTENEALQKPAPAAPPVTTTITSDGITINTWGNSSNSTAESAEESAEEPEEGNSLGYIVCTADESVPVLDKDLKATLFTADQFEGIIPIQSWDEKQKTTHLEVQFPQRQEGPTSGWLPRTVVQMKSECAPLKAAVEAAKKEQEGAEDSTDVVPSTAGKGPCCKFPTPNRSTQPYTQGTLKFRAARIKGRRLHAGCDIYRKKGEAALAVAPGKVLRGPYYFYQGVFAVEIKHPSFIARYGEILGNIPKAVRKSKTVEAGQPVGYLGKVNSGCCAPMLHFELYKGTAHGPLSRYRVPPYDRRSDLMDPTPLLQKWEKNQFGKSY